MLKHYHKCTCILYCLSFTHNSLCLLAGLTDLLEVFGGLRKQTSMTYNRDTVLHQVLDDLDVRAFQLYTVCSRLNKPPSVRSCCFRIYICSVRQITNNVGILRPTAHSTYVVFHMLYGDITSAVKAHFNHPDCVTNKNHRNLSFLDTSGNRAGICCQHRDGLGDRKSV